MKILIIGTGAIGVALAASLAEVGEEVSLISRGDTYRYISEKGVARRGLFGDVDISADRIRTFCDYSAIKESFDYIIITTKSLANEEVAKKLSGNGQLFSGSTRIVIGQNGWGNTAPYEKYFDRKIIYNARIITGFARLNPGTSNITVHTAPVLIGSLFGESKEAVEPLAAAINSSGIPSQASEELEEALWAKMLYNTTLNPLGAILGCAYGKLTESEYSVKIMNQLIEETFAVIKACGFKCYWKDAAEYEELFYGKLIPDTYGHRSSTLQDIEKKIPTEIDTLNGCIIRLGKEKSIATPAHSLIYNLIKSIEAGY